MTAPSNQLTAGPVTLRRWHQSDLDELDAAITESLPHLVPWLSWAGSPDQRAGLVEFLTRSDEEWSRGTDFGYAILLGGRIAGSIGLMARRGPTVLEIGYWVGAPHTRRGVASRATALCTAAGLDLPVVAAIEIRHDAANTASEGVPRGLGFERIGEVTRRPAAPAETPTEVVWRLTEDQYPASRVPELLAP